MRFCQPIYLELAADWSHAWPRHGSHQWNGEMGSSHSRRDLPSQLRPAPLSLCLECARSQRRQGAHRRELVDFFPFSPGEVDAWNPVFFRGFRLRVASSKKWSEGSAMRRSASRCGSLPWHSGCDSRHVISICPAASSIWHLCLRHMGLLHLFGRQQRNNLSSTGRNSQEGICSPRSFTNNCPCSELSLTQSMRQHCRVCGAVSAPKSILRIPS
jgi:hypothetical protein